jgi:hypothetical protein
MKFDQQIIVKRWRLTLEEYEKMKNKVLHPYIKQFLEKEFLLK